uniref:Uncharacterized protein n=1 Tax=Globisporangium ultimum (strain ATCC 200006 / CBS 805.95 / DAOM BR144) TaxID=431595 RepID=K3W9I0_GLOUD
MPLVTADISHEDVSEALLLAETERLLSCLEPTAFVPPTTDATPAPQSASTSPQSNSEKPVSRRGRRSWKASGMRNPSRDRLMVELSTLREQASTLEAELVLARRHRHALEQSNLLLMPAWGRIAKRQLRARQKAEDENKRLKTMVETQRMFVRQLQHTWHQWQAMASGSPYSQMFSKTVCLNANDIAILEMLVSELDVEYMRLDHVFRDAGLVRKKAEYEEGSNCVVKTRLGVNGRTPTSFLELSEIEVDPFEFQLFSRITWECVVMKSAQRNCVSYEDVKNQGHETHATKYRERHEHNGKVVFLDTLTVDRRYIENDRTTHVWRKITRDENNVVSNSFIVETGWIMLQNLAYPSSSSPTSVVSSSTTDLPTRSSYDSEGGTLTLTCVHVEPHVPHDAPPPLPDSDPLTQLVVTTFKDEFDEVNDMIENLLLDEAIAAQQDAMGSSNPTRLTAVV